MAATSTTDQVDMNGAAGGRKHVHNDALCRHFHTIELGRAADRWLNGSYGPLPVRGAVAVMPTWLWLPADRKLVGRKALDPSGGRFLLPIRVLWKSGPLMVVPSRETERMPWHANGVGHTNTGVVEVHAKAYMTERPPTLDGMTEPPPKLDLPLQARSAIRRDLELLSEQGKHAMWKAIMMLEPWTKRAVRSASRSLEMNIVANDGQIFDAVTHDEVVNSMMFGHDADKGLPALPRLIEKCVGDRNVFRKVDPAKFVTDAIIRDAKWAVRRQIDDPRCGDRIRALAAETGLDDPVELAELYNRRWPGISVGPNRVERALQTAHDAASGAVQLDRSSVGNGSTFSSADCERRTDRRHSHDMASPSAEDLVLDRMHAIDVLNGDDYLDERCDDRKDLETAR